MHTTYTRLLMPKLACVVAKKLTTIWEWNSREQVFKNMFFSKQLTVGINRPTIAVALATVIMKHILLWKYIIQLIISKLNNIMWIFINYCMTLHAASVSLLQNLAIDKSLTLTSTLTRLLFPFSHRPVICFPSLDHTVYISNQIDMILMFNRFACAV